jgi:hypothetical protein
MAAALMSNLSAVLNSASTLVTIDFYKKLIRPNSTEQQQVRFGRIGGTVILVAAATIAWTFSRRDVPLFIQVQNVFFWIAPPFSVIFCAGLLWRRANTVGALATIVFGFTFTWFFDYYTRNYMKAQQGVYLHRAFLTWCFCVIVMVVASWLTGPFTDRLRAIVRAERERRPEDAEPVSAGLASHEATAVATAPEPVLAYESAPMALTPLQRLLATPPQEQIRSILWTPQYARLPVEEKQRYHGLADFRIWWLLFVGMILAIYAFFLWFRFQHPVKMLPW